LQHFEDALEEIPEKNSGPSKKHSSSKDKVVKKLSKLKMKDKSVKNGELEDRKNQV